MVTPEADMKDASRISAASLSAFCLGVRSFPSFLSWSRLACGKATDQPVLLEVAEIEIITFSFSFFFAFSSAFSRSSSSNLASSSSIRLRQENVVNESVNSPPRNQLTFAQQQQRRRSLPPLSFEPRLITSEHSSVLHPSC